MHSSITSLTERRGVRQFVKFGIVGASGTLVNLVIFTLVRRVDPAYLLPLHYYVTYSIAFLAGGVSNYWLNRIWTFRSTGHAVHEGAKFLTVSAIALVAGLIVSWLAAPYLGHGHKLWFIATVAGIFVNFFVNKHWTFRHAN